MDANERELIFKDEVYTIVSRGLVIINGLGHGFYEKTYENALAVEFQFGKIPFMQQPRYPIARRDVKIGEYLPDPIAFGQIIIDTKTNDRITHIERGRCLTTFALPAFKSASFSTSKTQN